MSENTPTADRSQLWQAPVDTSASILSAAMGAQADAAHKAAGANGLTNSDERAFAQKQAEEAAAYAKTLEGQAFGAKQQVMEQTVFVEKHNEPINYAIKQEEEKKAGAFITGALGLAATVAVVEATHTGLGMMSNPGMSTGMGLTDIFGKTAGLAALTTKDGQGITFKAPAAEGGKLTDEFGATASAEGKPEPVISEMQPSNMFNARSAKDFMALAMLDASMAISAQQPTSVASTPSEPAVADAGLDTTATPVALQTMRRPSQSSQFLPAFTPTPPKGGGMSA